MEYRPGADQSDKQVFGEFAEEHLRNSHVICHQLAVDHHRRIRGIEEFDRISSLLATNPIRLQRELHSKSLQINHHHEDHKSGNQVR